ncbi:MAG: ArsC/Spx/MgsR family protein [Acidimicrobiales bacterium]
MNPLCSKCRTARQVLEERGVAFDVVEYLETPPDAVTLGRLLDLLGGDPAELVRTDDAGFAELGLTPDDVSSSRGVIAVLLAHPELMQRPVLVSGTRAVIGRTPERLAELLGPS